MYIYIHIGEVRCIVSATGCSLHVNRIAKRPRRASVAASHPQRAAYPTHAGASHRPPAGLAAVSSSRAVLAQCAL